MQSRNFYKIRYSFITLNGIFAIAAFAICFATLAIIQSCSVSNYNKEEAERSLKVLNSDLTNFMAATIDRKELKALEFLWNEPSAPFPFKPSFTNCNFADDSIRNVLFGSYEWNKKSKQFEKTSSSLMLVYNFPLEGSATNNAELSILSLKSDKISSCGVFPSEMKAELYIDKQLYLTFDFNSTYNDSLLSTLKAVFTGADYRAETTYNRSKVKKSGVIDCDYRFDAAGITLIQGRISANIKYKEKGYSIEKIKTKHHLFHHTIEADIDYDKVDKTAINFGSELNRHTKAAIYEMPLKKKLGDIIIESQSGKDKQLQYYIRFQNNEQFILSNYLLPLKKFQDLKY